MFLIQQDWEISGFITTSYIGIIINVLCLIHIIKSTSTRDYIKSSIKYYSIAILTSTIIWFIITSIFRTNIIFNFDFHPNSIACQIPFYVSYISLMCIGRSSMYILFIHRLEILLTGSPHAPSNTLLKSIKVIIILWFICSSPGIFYLQRIQVLTPKYRIELCTINTSFDATYGNINLIIYSVMDVLISFTLLYLYCYNLWKIKRILIASESDNDQNLRRFQMIQKLQGQLMKTSILVATAVISTLMFSFIGNFIWWSLGWFFPMDVIIKVIAVYLMFGFTDNVYRKLCYLCIFCCDKCCVKEGEVILSTPMQLEPVHSEHNEKE